MDSGPGPLERAVDGAIGAAEVPPVDQAAVQLARRYAQLLDQAHDTDGEPDLYDALGPKLLAALTALGLTLAGRGKGVKGGADVRGSGKLDELRARRARAG